MCSWQQLLKIVQGRFFLMVSIEINKIEFPVRSFWFQV